MNDITLLSIISASFTFIILLIKQSYKSKCTTIDCLCFKISRNIKKEVEEHKFDINNGINNDDVEAIKNSININK